MCTKEDIDAMFKKYNDVNTRIVRALEEYRKSISDITDELISTVIEQTDEPKQTDSLKSKYKQLKGRCFLRKDSTDAHGEIVVFSSEPYAKQGVGSEIIVEHTVFIYDLDDTELSIKHWCYENSYTITVDAAYEASWNRLNTEYSEIPKDAVQNLLCSAFIEQLSQIIDHATE